MRKTLPALAGLTALAAPLTNGVAALRAASGSAATPKPRVITKTIAGTEVEDGRWGPLQVSLVVRKTIRVVNGRRRQKRRITRVTVPEYPADAPRSAYINEQALPVLVDEVMTEQLAAHVDTVSGATHTSDAFEESLQSALVVAKSF